MTKRYLGNIITQNPTAPAGNFEGSAAKGVWSLEEQLAYQKAGLWPVPGNTPLDITDVFSTYLYTGNGGTQTVTNGIDLAGEGGLVWLKPRDLSLSNRLMDSARGPTNYLVSDTTDQQQVGAPIAFSSSGFSVASGGASWNQSSNTYASWTFRKAPKFFDCVTWTGDGSAAPFTLSHNLGASVGMSIVKTTSHAAPWIVNHISIPSNYLSLNTTAAAATDVTMTSTDSTITFNGSSVYYNRSGRTYVAYLFAHNDGDGGFGPDGSDIIKCGSFSVNGSYEADVNLGFEPQWVLIKPAQDSGSWLLFDTMRGAAVNGDAAWLAPDLTQAEANTANRFWPTATGFHIGNYGIAAGNDIIYIAIRRGPLAPPTAGTEVFAVGDGSAGASGNAGRYRSGFSVDMGLEKDITGIDNWELVTRLLSGTSLRPNGTNAEDTGVGGAKFDYMDGWNSGTAWADSYSWMWKRAPSYFDVVTYTGDNATSHAIDHNLGVVPEMMWCKGRSIAKDWNVYHSGLGTSGGNQGYLEVNDTAAAAYNAERFPAAPTSTQFIVGNNSRINSSGSTYIAYLFATLAGVSKVGSFTGNGSSQTIDCGFTSGARFILIKRTDSTGDWYIWDTERGIVAGNDPHLSLNTTAAEVTSADSIDPDNSGFIVNQVSATNINVSSASYIFYAIA
jgi:hypothetical protein